MLRADSPLTLAESVANDSGVQRQVLHALLHRCLPFAAAAFHDLGQGSPVSTSRIIAAGHIVGAVCTVAGAPCLHMATRGMLLIPAVHASVLRSALRLLQVLPLTDSAATQALPMDCQISVQTAAVQLLVLLCCADPAVSTAGASNPPSLAAWAAVQLLPRLLAVLMAAEAEEHRVGLATAYSDLLGKARVPSQADPALLSQPQVVHLLAAADAAARMLPALRQQRGQQQQCSSAAAARQAEAQLAHRLADFWWSSAALCSRWAGSVTGGTEAGALAVPADDAASVGQLASLAWQLHSTTCRHVHLSLGGDSPAPLGMPAAAWWSDVHESLQESLHLAVACQEHKREAGDSR